MKRVIASVILILGLTQFHQAKEENGNRVVLPNPQLLRCKSSDCFDLWSGRPPANAVFPKQVSLDFNQGCIYGLTALYDKSIPLEDVESAIDERYGKWVVPGFAGPGMRLWRVESEKFAIQFTVADKWDQKVYFIEAGTKRVIYIAFNGEFACNAVKMGEMIDKEATEAGFRTAYASNETRLVLTDFEASDGVRVHYEHGQFRSPKEAKRYLHWKVARASRILKRGVNTDSRGRSVGLKAEVVLAADHKDSAVMWTDGATFYEVISESLADAEEFAKRVGG
jgi:hypothetical protein